MIRTLYANGDSWTFGQELRDEKPDSETYKYYNSYPWLVSQKLGIPQLVNDSLGGASNYRIFRKTVDYITNYKGNYNELYVMVAWTSYERKEIPLVIKRSTSNGYDGWEYDSFEHLPVLLNNPGHWRTDDFMYDKAIDSWQKNNALFDNPISNRYYFFYQQWLLKNLCNSLGVNLLQMYALENPEFVKGTPEANEEWLEKINPYPVSLTRMIIDKPELRAPGGHPNEEGHKYIADQIVAIHKDYTLWAPSFKEND